MRAAVFVLLVVFHLLTSTFTGGYRPGLENQETRTKTRLGSLKQHCDDKCRFPRHKLPLVRPIESGHYIKDRFKDKVVLVTGAARGIGRAVAIRAAMEGAKIVLVDVLKEDGIKTKNYLKSKGTDVLFVQTDVTSTTNWTFVMQAATGAFGRVDCAVNSAAVIDRLSEDSPSIYRDQKELLPQRIHLADDSYFDRVMDVNINGVFKAMRAELSQMIRQHGGGTIVNVGSIDGRVGTSDNPAYVASKHTLCGLTKAAAIDYAKQSIRINSVNMAATDTPLLNRQIFLLALKRRTGTVSPMVAVKENSLLSYYETSRRPSTIWEQVSTILYLLSPDASHITGSNMATDGGWTTY